MSETTHFDRPVAQLHALLELAAEDLVLRMLINQIRIDLHRLGQAGIGFFIQFITGRGVAGIDGLRSDILAQLIGAIGIADCAAALDRLNLDGFLLSGLGGGGFIGVVDQAL